MHESLINEHPSLQAHLSEEGIELLQGIWENSPNKPALLKQVELLEKHVSRRNNHMKVRSRWLDEDNPEMAAFELADADKRSAKAIAILNRLGLGSKTNLFIN